MNDNKEKFINSFFQTKSHNNFILDLNPFVKLEVSILTTFAVILLGKYWNRVFVILLCFLVTALAGKKILHNFVSLFIPIGTILFLFLVVLNSSFQPGDTVYFEWWIVEVTKEGFLYGMAMALLIVSICGIIMTFYNITPIKDLMYSLEKFGMPRSSSYICLASLQGVTDLGKSVKTIMESQSARGVETQGNLMVRFKALIPILFPVLLSSIAETEEKTVAMETRAFAASANATHVYELRKTPVIEKIGCIILNIIVIAAIIWRFIG